ncbi:MAG: hypothetical protein JNN15_12610, partial [Blastocatellia bacterium]|nr:hypothetical protein [Blastocatellia bacterium]
MIAKITQKEFTEIVRDGRYRWMASIIFVLLTVSILTGWHHYANVSREHKLAQEAQRNLWLGQGEKNPHS